MKVGILTIHAAYNYGAMLQAYATQEALKKLGHEVQIIDFYPIDLEQSNLMTKTPKSIKELVKYVFAKLNPHVQKKIRRFNEFRGLMQLSSRYYSKEELYRSPPKFDLFLVGSDQVWNMERSFNSFYFLDFINSKNKISYASSFGTSSIPAEYHKELKEHLSTFSAISTRESDGVRIIKDAVGIDATQVLDPTFLLTAENWAKIAADKQFKGDYILAYGFSKSAQFGELISSVKKRYQLPIVAIAIGSHYPYKVDKCFLNTGPKEFIALFRDAKVVCTDSFHGLAFSIHFRKTFFSIPHPTRNSRLDSLLSLLNLKNRQIENSKKISDLQETELNINYSAIETLIEENIKLSFDYLKTSISK